MQLSERRLIWRRKRFVSRICPVLRSQTVAARPFGSRFADARRGSRELDLTDAEAEKLGGRVVARRGRKPKTAN